MDKFKGTPGPWVYRKGTREIGVIDCSDTQSYGMIDVICYIDQFGHRDCFDDNARLIAAAPELLEALQEVVAISDRKHEAWDKAHAAIAKALGEDQ